EALIPKCEQAMGKLDILVANAGITKDNLLVQLRDEDWDQVVAINLTATFRLARAALRGMMRQRFGRIIGITSVVDITGNPGQANYTASKAGMVGMIKSIAAEYAKRGVTANCIAPGMIATAMTDKLSDKQRETILARVPAGRLGAGADVAPAAVFLASQEAAYITGQTLHVNGGRGGIWASSLRPRRAGGAAAPCWSRHLKYGNRASVWLGRHHGSNRHRGPLATR